MFCRDCGKRIAEGAAFCSGCGAAINTTGDSVFSKAGDLQATKTTLLRNDICSNPPTNEWGRQSDIPLQTASGFASQPEMRQLEILTEPVCWADNREQKDRNFKQRSNPRRKTLIVISAVATVLIIAVVAIVLLNGALISTGKCQYRYFGSLAKLLKTKEQNISAEFSANNSFIGSNQLVYKCNDYTLTIFLKYAGTSSYTPSSPDRYIELTRGTAMVTGEGVEEYFNDYSEVLYWIECENASR